MSAAPPAPRVIVRHGADGYAITREAIAAAEPGGVAGRRLLLKPNVGRVAAPGDGVTTNPPVVAACIDAFRELGAEVAVGESPIIGINTREALAAAGITAVAEERGCPLLDLDEGRFRDMDSPDGVAMKRFRLCPAVKDFDAVVSIPVAKTHMHTGVTLSVKNMKGCLWRRSKVDLHMLDPVAGHDDKSLNLAINDMARVLRPDIAVVDATVGMEGLGPSAGTPKRLDTVLVSTDGYAADAVACALMGIAAEDVPHLRLGAENGHGVIDLDAIAVDPPEWRGWTDPFELPPENPAIEFDNVEILDRQSCSACQSTLLLFLKRFGDRLFDYFPSDTPLKIAIGLGHEDLPEGTLCIGNCTTKHRGRGIFVPGCPPVGSNIMKAIEDGHEKAADDACED